MVQYAVGATDKFQGTGVWSFVEFDRQGDDDVEENGDEKSSLKDKSEAKGPSPAEVRVDPRKQPK